MTLLEQRTESVNLELLAKQQLLRQNIAESLGQPGNPRRSLFEQFNLLAMNEASAKAFGIDDGLIRTQPGLSHKRHVQMLPPDTVNNIAKGYLDFSPKPDDIVVPQLYDWMTSVDQALISLVVKYGTELAVYGSRYLSHDDQTLLKSSGNLRRNSLNQFLLMLHGMADTGILYQNGGGSTELYMPYTEGLDIVHCVRGFGSIWPDKEHAYHNGKHFDLDDNSFVLPFVILRPNHTGVAIYPETDNQSVPPSIVTNLVNQMIMNEYRQAQDPSPR